MSRRRVWAVVAGVLAAAGLGVVGPARASEAPDFIRVNTVAGADGAAVIEVTVSATVYAPGPETLVVGTAVGIDVGGFRGGFVDAAEATTTGLTLASTGVGAGARVAVAPPVGLAYEAEGGARYDGGLEPGDRLDIILFFANGQVEAHDVNVSVAAGSVSTTTSLDSGSTALAIGDETTAEGSNARAVNGVASGSSVHHTAPSTGIAGTVLDSCLSCDGTWASPGGSTWEWAYPAPAFPELSFPGFAGPSGDWSWSWYGSKAMAGSSAVVAAWVPVGNDWQMFRTGPDFSGI